MEVGQKPSRILTDFDHKLCSKKIPDCFTDNDNGTCIMKLAPPRHQDKNGLSKRNWATVLQISRGWMASSLLPSEYWWYKIKHTVEVSNYFPITVNDLLTNPHKFTHGPKPDLCCLFPQFNVADI